MVVFNLAHFCMYYKAMATKASAVSIQWKKNARAKEQTKDPRNIPMNLKTLPQITGKRMLDDARATGYQ